LAVPCLALRHCHKAFGVLSQAAATTTAASSEAPSMPDNAVSVANRDDAIPVISITDDDPPRSKSPANRERSKSSSRIDQLRASHASATAKMRSKLESKLHGGESTKSESSASVQDRLMNMCVARLDD
jgi:hypothetical protein